MIKLCEKCGKPATDRHHKFSQSKLNKKLYKDYIHSEMNIQYLCQNCHLFKPVDKLTELEFCEIIGIEPRSKSGKDKFKRGILCT